MALPCPLLLCRRIGDSLPLDSIILPVPSRGVDRWDRFRGVEKEVLLLCDPIHDVITVGEEVLCYSSDPPSVNDIPVVRILGLEVLPGLDGVARTGIAERIQRPFAEGGRADGLLADLDVPRGGRDRLGLDRLVPRLRLLLVDPDETLALGFDSIEGPGDAIPGDTVVRLGDLLRKTAAEDVEQVSGGRVLADDDRFRPGFPSKGPIDFGLCRGPAGLPTKGLQPLLRLLDRLTAEDRSVVEGGYQIDVWDDDGSGLRAREGLLTERPKPGVIESLLARQRAVEPWEAVHHRP